MVSLRATYRQPKKKSTTPTPPVTLIPLNTTLLPSNDLDKCKRQLEDSELRLLRCSTEHHKDLIALEACNDRAKQTPNNEEITSCRTLANNCTGEIINTRVDLANCLAQNVGLRFEADAWASKLANCQNQSKQEVLPTPPPLIGEVLPTPASLIATIKPKMLATSLSPLEEWNFHSCTQELHRIKIKLEGCKHMNLHLLQIL
ncbi:hypothetical protein QE152_g38678 [Popillia japonica]|uniref:Uncharacterized protein n=1 Tax=Popillia japonica TaxID=7064 RepID=A0AAW1HWC8_POPJA